MKTCTDMMNRVLAGDANAPEVRAHLDGCPDCAALAALWNRVQSLPAADPVPASLSESVRAAARERCRPKLACRGAEKRGKGFRLTPWSAGVVRVVSAAAALAVLLGLVLTFRAPDGRNPGRELAPGSPALTRVTPPAEGIGADRLAKTAALELELTAYSLELEQTLADFSMDSEAIFLAQARAELGPGGTPF